MRSLWPVAKLFMLSFCLIAEASATEKVSPYVGLGSDMFAFNIDSFSDAQKELSYEPNIPGLTRVGISAFGLGASLSTRGSTKDLEETKGESEFFDFQVGYHNTKWGVDLYVQNYEGFYLKNSEDVGGTPNYYLFPDIKFNHYGLMGRYALDNNGFSISALLNQSDEITKSAGSYFLVGGLRQHSFETENTLIPAPLQGVNVDMDNLRKLSVNTLNLGVGAGKYWVSSSKFFIGAVIDAMGTFGLYKYSLTTEDRSSDYGTLSVSAKFGTGYAGKKWRSGVSAYTDSTTLQALDRTYIKPQAMAFLIYVRYVFD